MRSGWIGLALLAAFGCEPSGVLVVSVRSDLSPGRDFQRIEVVLTPPGGDARELRHEASSAEDYTNGVRVVELEGVGVGEHALVVRAVTADGELVVGRPVRTNVEGSGVHAVTVLLTLSCRGIECPLASDAPTDVACLAGRCVDEACTEETPERCGPPACATAAECPGAGVSCAVAECTPSGACFSRFEDAMCGPGESCGPSGCVDPTACTPVAAEMVAMESSALGGFSLGRGGDLDMRFWSCANCMRARQLSGADLAGIFRTDVTPPVGGAVSPTGTRVAVVYGTALGLSITTMRASGGTVGSEQRVGGACPSARCAAALGDRFAVLRGPSALTLVDLDPATGAASAGPSVVAASSDAAIREAVSSVLITYGISGRSCVVERWGDVTAAIASATIPACARPDVAELADGRIVVGYLDPSDQSVHVAFLASDLTGPTGDRVLDDAQAGPRPVEVTPTPGGFRATWLDDGPPLLVRSARFDAAGAPLGTDCVANDGHALGDYQRFRTVRRASGTALAWPSGAAVFETVLGD